MGIKDKLRNSLQGPIVIPGMQTPGQQQDTNYFVQLDSKYDYGASPVSSHGYDLKGPDFAYPAEYQVTQMPYGGEGGEGMQFGGSAGADSAGREEGDEFSEYLNLMVHFRERDWNVTLRKIDMRVLPPFLVAYLFAFMDRSNIGNARLGGLLDTTKMTEHEFQAGTAAFFALYIALEVPSQFVLKRFGSRRYLSLLVFLCGVVMSSGAAINDAKGFTSMRLALGATESGLMPGFNAVLATFHTRAEISTRIAIFFASASISGAFSGALAYGLSHLGGVAGLESWRWIWLLEGAATALMGVIAFWIFPDEPKNAGNWLTKEEKRFLELRQRYAMSGGVGHSEAYSVSVVKDLLIHWQTWMMSIIYLSHSVLGYSISFTLPVLMKTLGLSTTASYLVPVPIFLAATAFTIGNSWLSDRRESRFLHIVFPFSLSIIGVALTVPTAGEKSLVGLSILGLICLVLSAYGAVPVSIAWCASNFVGAERSLAIGIQISLGGFGGLAGSFIYITSESPKYPTGYFTSLAVAALAILAACALMYGYKRENQRRNELTREYIEENWPEEKLALAGDRSPHFRYQI